MSESELVLKGERTLCLPISVECRLACMGSKDAVVIALCAAQVEGWVLRQDMCASKCVGARVCEYERFAGTENPCHIAWRRKPT